MCHCVYVSKSDWKAHKTRSTFKDLDRMSLFPFINRTLLSTTFQLKSKTTNIFPTFLNKRSIQQPRLGQNENMWRMETKVTNERIKKKYSKRFKRKMCDKSMGHATQQFSQ